MGSKQETKSGEENPTEIPVPKETARALGRGLRQLLAEPIEQCSQSLDSFQKYSQTNPNYSMSAALMYESLKNFKGIIDNLEHAEKVKIVPFGNGWDFDFDGTTALEDQPVQSDIFIDDTTTPELSKLREVMQHRFNNAIAPLLGFSKLANDVPKDYDAWIKSGLIVLSADWMHKVLRPILQARSQLKISTDAQGRTTIEDVSPLKNPSMP